MILDYQIIQVLTTRLSRVSLQRYPDTDYTIRLTTTGDNLPSRRHLSSSFGEMTNYPGIVTLPQTLRHPLLFIKAAKDRVALSSGAKPERNTCGSRSTLTGPKGVERRVVCHPYELEKRFITTMLWQAALFLSVSLLQLF